MERLRRDLLRFPPRVLRGKARERAPAGPRQSGGGAVERPPSAPHRLRQPRLRSHLQSWRSPSHPSLPAQGSRRRGRDPANPTPSRMREGKETFAKPRGPLPRGAGGAARPGHSCRASGRSSSAAPRSHPMAATGRAGRRRTARLSAPGPAV